MPIQTQDLVIFKSDTMDDTAQGGGSMTGNVVVGGLSNNIFEDISTLDRVYGAVHMRKLFPSVFTQTQDKYFGSHVIISKLPTDTKLGINLFDSQDWFDRRPEAQTRVENYRAKGANYSGFLWATQWKESKVVTLFQSVSAPIPGVGDVLYLTQISDTQVQFIKILTLSESIQTFTDSSGEFKRRIVELTISQNLEYDFVGAQINRLDTIAPQATIKATVVANAAKYYSARPLADAGSIGDLTLKVDTVYSQVIPSSLQELAILDADLNGISAPLYDSAQNTITVVMGTTFSANKSFYLGSPCLPGTLSIAVSGGTIIDDGGNIKIGATVVGSINYIEGTFTFSSTSPSYSGNKNVTFKPAAAPVKVADTAMLAVTAANRGFVWNNTISPAPLPGSVQVSFRALGEWFTLYDNGTGGLLGVESGIGSGTINYVTGTVSATFTALPDVGSAIIFSWGKAARFNNRSDLVAEPVVIKHTLANQGVAPNTLVITWNDGAARTATASATGVISGDAVGTVKHATGELEFTPTTLPLGGTQFTVDYDSGTPQEKIFTAPVKAGGVLVLDLLATNILTNSVEVDWNVTPDNLIYEAEAQIARQSINGIIRTRDDGTGLLKTAAGATIASSSMNYTAGVLTFDPDNSVSLITPSYTSVQTGNHSSGYGGAHYGFDISPPSYENVHTGFAETVANAPFPQDGSGVVSVRFRTADSPTTKQDIITANDVYLDLTHGFDETIVPGSVRFTLGGLEYIDRAGLLYHSIDPDNGAGTFAGTSDYTTGNQVISSWATNSANTISLKSLATESGKEPVGRVVFRIPNAPVKVGSVQIRAVTAAGVSITATPDATGYINTPEMQGWCEYETGVIEVSFGAWITAAGNEGEPWYNAAAVDVNGDIFRTDHVFADTLFYNATSQTFLPLDSAILGLNPVRLPQDGRVPIFADGDVVVILHDQKTSGTYVNATQTDLGRGRIAKLNVRDSAGQEILASRYTADLDLGLIDWIDLSTVSQPLEITNRIEDMAMLSDVQITGTLALSQPLTHDFPVGETLVANAVIYGDLFAHTSIPFDQQTWNGAWSDILQGSQVSAQYNNAGYPMQVDNASCIQERWYAIFTSATLVHIIGEGVGQILTSVSIGSDIAPINPNTAQPYFTIPSGGWGAGWSAGNILRFNTIGANAPLWLIQSVAQGDATDDDYNFCIELRGDIDTP
ncbi:MAG: hypothetical protein COA83_09735 [Methylophaga sp.]|nr:MAG: hypothetical protein COA83_09735 [Methylophaga sp.]